MADQLISRLIYVLTDPEALSDDGERVQIRRTTLDEAITALASATRGDYYVVRRPKGNANRISWIVESRPISDNHTAQRWRDFVATEHPKDEVFIVFKELNDG